MKTNSSKKRIITTLSAMVLTGSLAVFGTLAYLSNVTEVKKNVFTSSNDVDVEVKEEKWETEGKDQASNYTPGDVIAKDPTISVAQDSESAWVGVKLSFLANMDGSKDDEGNPSYTNDEYLKYGQFKGFAQHDGAKDGWKKIAENNAGEELYIFETAAITAGKSAPTIFDNITVNAGITKVDTTTTKTLYKGTYEQDENGEWILKTQKVTGEQITENTVYYDQDGNVVTTTSLPTFEIGVQGFAVQESKIDSILAAEEMINLANQNVEENSQFYFTAV